MSRSVKGPNYSREVQWRAGNAEPVDTGTETTAATPTPSTTGSVDADSQPFRGLFSRMLGLEKQGYLIKITDGQVERAEVFRASFGQPEHPSRLKRWEELREVEREQRNLAFQALRLEYPTLDPILKLHSPDEYGECQGCDGGPDYAGDWPCRTIETIKEEY